MPTEREVENGTRIESDESVIGSECESECDCCESCSSGTLQLRLGPGGRCLANDGSMNFAFRSFPHALRIKTSAKTDNKHAGKTEGSYSSSFVASMDEQQIADALRADCRVAFKARAVRQQKRSQADLEFDVTSDERGSDSSQDSEEEDKDEEKYSTGDTFFVQANSEPRCTLEALALQAFKFHSAGCDFDPESSGAEWWTLVLNAADDSVAFHWDRDYELEDSGVALNPHLATVTYLTSTGAPTLVVPQRAPLSIADSSLPTDGGRCEVLSLSFPRAGKHMCFDGQFLHAALEDVASALAEEREAMESSAEGPRELKRARTNMKSSAAKADINGAETRVLVDMVTGERITLLINVWLNHRPTTAQALPKELLEAMTSPSERIEFVLDDGEVQPALQLRVDESVPKEHLRAFKWQFPGGVGEDNFGKNEGDSESGTVDKGSNWTYELSATLPIKQMARAFPAGTLADAVELVYTAEHPTLSV